MRYNKIEHMFVVGVPHFKKYNWKRVLFMANENMKISQNGRNLIKEFEGLRLQAYQDQVGVWTIGYGHTQGVKAGMSITEAQANAYLDEDIKSHAYGVYNYVKVQLNQNQFDALVSFHFNLGAYILQGSTLLTYINNKQWQAAAKEMNLYINAGGKPNDGLIRRRKAETDLFLKAVEQQPNDLKAEDIIRIKPTASKWNKKTQTKDAPFDSVDKSLRFKVLKRDGILLNIQTLNETYGGWIYDWDANLVSKTSAKENNIIKFTDSASAWSKRIQEKNAAVTVEDKGKYYKVLSRAGYMLNIQVVDGSYGGWIYDWDARIIAPTTVGVNANVVFKTSAKKWYKRTETFNASVDAKDRSTTFTVLMRNGNMLNIQAIDKSYGGWAYDWDIQIK